MRRNERPVLRLPPIPFPIQLVSGMGRDGSSMMCSSAKGSLSHSFFTSTYVQYTLFRVLFRVIRVLIQCADIQQCTHLFAGYGPFQPAFLWILVLRYYHHWAS
uniref:Uncharacterized protein n=1 Tax=Oryza barthii TaxID=65489 RepID=A0A0D3H1G5_9ORYZ